ncbi:hypothetical protein GSI_14706 [Ganoderma sinense ZZ0214-1]|uniref:Uncharacterized protein n=1 Tax=Ganoderma sinense ZZ0214-1 TaxID=1077348 RepID=A0A2G8RPE1_9APHY|nr:hypothetical protein GSI_14706 [Ganoderma sinense ZZ0214-1]
MRHLFGLINMFTSIDRLFVDCGPWELPVGDPNYELSPASPIIRDLTLQALEDPNCAIMFYNALRRSGSLDGPLKVIQFACYTRGEVVDFFDFLKDAGKHLTELNIDMYFPLRWSRGDPGSWDALSLDCCPNLEKLTLVFDFDAPDEMLHIRDVVLQTALQLYTRLLRSAPRRLREVSFCIYGAANARPAFTRSAAASEGRERWAALDRALSGPGTALASVKFLLCDVDGKGELEECKAGLVEFVAECMPTVAGRGLVRLRSEREEYPD